MHKFIVMRQDDIQCWVATPHSYLQFLNVTKFYGKLKWGLIYTIVKPRLKEIYKEIRAFATMHRFILMRQDAIQSLVATSPSYLQFSPWTWRNSMANLNIYNIVAMLEKDLRRNKGIFNHAQIHCDETRWYPEFGSHTHFLPLIQSVNVKKFYDKLKWRLIYNIM